MTVAEALAEAKRRWGAKAWVQEGHPYPGRECAVGMARFSEDSHFQAFGQGRTFEEAFAQADHFASWTAASYRHLSEEWAERKILKPSAELEKERSKAKVLTS